MVNFEEFYVVYLSKHENKWTRRIHMLGNLATIAWFVYFSYLGICVNWMMLFWLLLTPFVVYPFAWSSHWIIEGNRPAAFKNPLRSKRADWRMMADIFRGKIDF